MDLFLEEERRSVQMVLLFQSLGQESNREEDKNIEDR